MLKPLRILMIEDCTDDAVLLQHTLHRAGYELQAQVVDTAPAMRAALESAEWDVITSDHAMPHFNAPHALALAAELRPQIPFLIVSSEIDLHLAVELLRSGACDYIHKGEMDRLAPAIERELREAATRREREAAEQTLRQTETSYREIFNATGDAIFVHEAPPSGRIVDVNQVVVDQFGYSREEMIGLGIQDISSGKPPFSEQEAIAWVRKARDEGPQLYEWRYKRKNGEVFWAEVKLRSAKIDGQMRVLVVVRDITDRKLAAESLRESEERYRQVVELSPDAVFLHQNGRILYVNPAAREMCGASTPEELVGQSVLDRVHPDFRGIVTERIGTMNRQAGAIPLIEEKFLRLDGSPVDVEVTATPIRHQGRPAIMVIAREISERRKAQEAQQQSARRILFLREMEQAILSAQSLPSIALTAMRHVRTFLQCDRANAVLFDRERQTVSFLAVDSEQPSVLDTRQEISFEEFGIEEELRAGKPRLTPDLRLLSSYSPARHQLLAEGILSLANIPLTIDDEVIGSINLGSRQTNGFSAEDIEVVSEAANSIAIAFRQARLLEHTQQYARDLETSVRERTTQLEAINQELEAFNHSVAHDLRAPIRRIDGFAHMVLEHNSETLSEEDRGILERIFNGCLRMTEITDDLMDLSRLSAYDLQREPVDLSAMAIAIAKELQLSNPERHVEWEVPEGLVALVDCRLIRIALENLFGNAWKFSARQIHARIEFGCRTDISDPNMQLRAHNAPVFYIRDNGAGFDPKYAHRLFGPFQRLHPAEDYAGSGIGLATVRRIIFHHGGQIWAEGNVGQGATFYFTVREGNSAL